MVQVEDLWGNIQNIVGSYFGSDYWSSIKKKMKQEKEKRFFYYNTQYKITGFAEWSKEKGMSLFAIFGTDREITKQDYERLCDLDISKKELAEFFLSTFNASFGAVYFQGQSKVFAVDVEKTNDYLFNIMCDTSDIISISKKWTE